MNDERDKVEEKSHINQTLNMNGYPDWLINSIPSSHPSLESTSSVLSNDTSDDGQERYNIQENKNPTSKTIPSSTALYLISIGTDL